MNRKKKQSFDQGNIKRVEQQLYAKNNEIQTYRRYGFHKDSHEGEKVPTTWSSGPTQKDVDLLEKKPQPPKAAMTFFTKILIISILFFTFSMGAAFMVYRLGLNEVSYDAIELSILGPNKVQGGEELSFDVSVANHNPVEVVLTDLVLRYPSGTLDPDGLPLRKEVISIESITPGLSRTVRFNAVMFGSQGENKKIQVRFQYRVPDSDQIFFEDRLYQVLVESTPVSLSVDHNELFINSAEMHVEINVSSNTSSELKNVLLSVDYPFGFDFVSSIPTGIDESSFLIKNLMPGESRKIKLRGVVRGQNGEERTIRYSLGSQNSQQAGAIGTVYTTYESSFTINKPAIKLDVLVNGVADEIIVLEPGDHVRVDIDYQNTLEETLLDGSITTALRGAGYQPSSVISDTGYYRSSDQTVSWVGSQIPSLRVLKSFVQGKTLNFSLKLNESENLFGQVVNPELVLKVQTEATRLGDGDTPESLVFSVSKRIKLKTQVGIDAYLLYSDGPLSNTGPLPAQVGSETTYTLVLTLANTTNEVEDGLVQLTLPRHTSLRDVFEPNSAQIDFDSRSRVLTWQSGNIEPGTTLGTPTSTLYLSLAHEPSLAHQGSVPILVEDIIFEGLDTFTNTQVEARSNDVSVELLRDSQ